MRTRFNLDKSTSVHVLPLTRAHSEPVLQYLEEQIESAAQLLSAHGPIGGFAFQNPLHALEYLPFDEAIQVSSRLFSCQPYLPEAQYRHALERGRIRVLDLRSVLEDEPGAWDLVGDLCPRLQMRLAALKAPILGCSPSEVQWMLSETNILLRFPAEIPPSIRQQLMADVKRWAIRDLTHLESECRTLPFSDHCHVLAPVRERCLAALAGKGRGLDDLTDPEWERITLEALWLICQEGVGKIGPDQAPATNSIRLRDSLLKSTGLDSDVFVNDLLIRFCAAFTDQGLAHWVVPKRDLGFFRCFLELYSQPGGPPNAWMRGLTDELRRILQTKMGPLDSILESLELLGIRQEQWPDFFPATVAALRGWASVIRQMEIRSDRVQIPVPRGTFTEFLAVRLILERVALTYVAREGMGYEGSLDELPRSVEMVATVPNDICRAFAIFQLALRSGWRPSVLYALPPKQWQEVIEEVESFDGVQRRRIFHAAYERRFRSQFLDAVAFRVKNPPACLDRPRFQSVYCVDAREESFRRHLEEICPDAETFGAAGFFGVPMYYRGIGEAFPTALCPIVMRPQHWVVEEPIYQLGPTHEQRADLRWAIGLISHGVHSASRSTLLGALVSAILGNLASVSLVAQVLFPRWTSWFAGLSKSLVGPPQITRLVIERSTPAPGPGEGEVGFSLQEMANLSERLLRDLGMTMRFSRIVFFFGHGSGSLNNPHLAAYHCGACSGNPGGPNARVVALMLNDRRVRAKLAERELTIPDDTVFVGGSHHTGDDTIMFYDLDLLPRSHYKDFQSACEYLDQACRHNAHERCRRFDSAPLQITPEAAHGHVHGRTVDLAQARAEFGNASNAACIVGRRERLHGLFLDRRSFLQSYDPTQDNEKGEILARILAAIIPVCSGINLEYYCSTVDPAGWGCGSKLPHNIVGMLGVMDGSLSDLRLGLPWQGVEIHEPVRLLFVIETYPQTMLGIMAGNPTIDRIIRNGWAQLALLDPDSAELQVWTNGEFHSYRPEETKLRLSPTSSAWYTGSREHLEFAHIKAGAQVSDDQEVTAS